MQLVRALGDEQGQEHGREGVIEAERLHVRDERAAEHADDGSADPGGLGKRRRRKKRAEVERPAFLEGRHMHGEKLVRHLPAVDEPGEAAQLSHIGHERHGHEDVAQIRDKDGRGRRKDARAGYPHGNGDELAGAGEHEHRHGDGQSRGNIVLHGQDAEGEGYGHVAQHDGKGALEAEPEIGCKACVRVFPGGLLLHGNGEPVSASFRGKRLPASSGK